MSIPDDAIGYRIAAVVPCLQCDGGRVPCNVYGCASEHRCTFCQGTGTRFEVTDVEIEQSWVIPPASAEWDSPHTPPVTLDPMGAAVEGSVQHWAEVNDE